MNESARPTRPRAATTGAALKFVLLIGVVSLFADFTYEGSRSITGPFLALLGASGTVVGVVAGFGELLGYGLRLVSGRLSERTQKFWPITLSGYVVQMLSVPLLALAGSWQAAALLILVERIGKAVRNHEALDQLGALIGPLVVAVVLSRRGDYRTAFAVLAVPAVITLTVLLLASLACSPPRRWA